MATKTEKATYELIINGELAQKSLKDLEGALRQVRAQARLTTDPKELEDLAKKYQNINGKIQDQNNLLKGTGGLWSRIKDEVKAFGTVAAAYLGFQFLSGQVKNLISQNARLSDSLSDIQQTTGMTADEAMRLNKELSKMNTRTATKDLREMSIVAGQLGVAQKDIKEFVRATDKLNVSLGREFGGNAEELTNVLGKLRNVLGDVKTDKIDQDMLRLGNALLSLGQAGLATSPVVADFANRIGGVGIPLGLTSGQVLGLSATLQELNVSTERGGTAITRILQKMTSDTENFAKIAGKDVVSFTKMLNEDLFGAFQAVVIGSQKSGASATALAAVMKDAELQGSGASEVFLKLAKNTELLSEKVKLSAESLKSTDLITESFNRKNNNMAANLEKIGKALAGAFVNSSVVNGMQNIVGWFAKMAETRVSETLVEEQKALAMLEVKLYDVNLPQKERIKLINELKEKYPNLLANIDAEKVSNQELSAQLSKVNDMLIRKIVLQRAEEDLADINDELADARITKGKKEIELQDAITQAQQRYNFKLKEGLTLQEQALAAAAFVREKVSLRAMAQESMADPAKRLWATLSDGVLQYDKAIDAVIRKEAQVNSAVTRRDRELRATLGDNGSSTSTPKDNPKPTGEEPAGSANALAENFLKNTQKLEDEIAKLRAESIIDEIERQKALLALDLQRQEVEIRDTEANASVKNALLEERRREYWRKIKAIDEKQGKDLVESELKQDIDNLDEWLKKQRLAYAQQRQQGTLAEQEYQDHLLELQQQYLVLKIKNYQDYGKDTTDLQIQLAELMTRITQKQVSAMEREFGESFSRLSEEAKQQATMLMQQISLIISTGVSVTGASLDELLKKLKQILEPQTGDEPDALQRFFGSEKFDRVLRQFQIFADGISSIWNSQNQIMENRDQQRLNKMRLNMEVERKNWDRFLSRKLVSQSEYNQAIANMELAQGAAERKAKRDSAIRSQRLGIFQASVNSAVAITQVLKEYGWPLGVIMGALMAVATYKQVQAIKSEPLPELRRGKRFSNIGKHPYSQQEVMDSSGMRYLVEDDETLLGASVRQQHPTIVDGLLDASQNNDGRLREPYLSAIYREFAQPNIERMAETARMAYGPVLLESGGRPEPDANFGRVVTNLQAQIDVQTRVMNRLLQRLDEPFEAKLGYRQFLREKARLDRITGGKA